MNFGNPWASSRYQAQRASAKRAKIRRFTEALANSAPGDSLSDIGRAVGISQQTASIYFREICGEIDQAQARAGYGRWTV